MVFSSVSFLFFIFPLFFLGDRLARRSGSVIWRNSSLLAVSLLFYIWGESTNVLILIFLGLMNYYGARTMAASPRAKIWAGLLVTLNLTVLFVFKYAAWVWSLIDPTFYGRGLGLPLGISFFTFHAISYVLDVYRQDVEPAATALDFMTYFCMFPHLVAGPIVRYAQVQEELVNRDDGPDMLSFGVYRFLLGFNKKLLVANTVSPLADAAFLGPQVGGFGDAWLGILAYTVQIYFDFSAYSDMAIGLAALAGFKFRENFLRPYSASSVRDFWRRWHISLSSWLRDYLYIPLGGNRSGVGRTYINLVLVFLLCGLWHGANFTFILWGLWHGLFLVVERLGWGRVLDKAPRLLSRFYTLLVVVCGWVFFRASDLGQAVNYLSALFNPFTDSTIILHNFSRAGFGLVVGIFLCLLPDRLLPAAVESRNPGAVELAPLVVQALLFVPSMISLIGGSRNPFIYFNF